MTADEGGILVPKRDVDRRSHAAPLFCRRNLHRPALPRWRDGLYGTLSIAVGQGQSNITKYGELASKWAAAGADWIGGCCRTGPEHIRAILGSPLFMRVPVASISGLITRTRSGSSWMAALSPVDFCIESKVTHQFEIN
jgi:hypothetical protein